MPKRRTTEEFIAICKEKHGDRYDYSQTKYIDSKSYVTIVCREHGPFQQTGSHHTQGRGCKKCASSSAAKSTSMFVEKAKKKHGDRYDYSSSVYTTGKNKIAIICRQHGPFYQRPRDHISGYNCPRCSTNQRLGIDTFITRSRKIHGDKYDYSLVEYVNSFTPVIIQCSKHGNFNQLPPIHMRGSGCPMCGYDIPTTQEFIDRCNKIHGGIYDYSLTEYTDAHSQVTIVCSHHGQFNQRAHCHLQGKGCPSCTNKTEGKVKMFLEENGFDFIHDKQWVEVLGRRRPDFVSHSLKLVLEIDGEQHFKQVSDWICPEEQQLIDTMKTIAIMRHGYSVIRISYLFLRREDWKDLLLPCIKKYEKVLYLFTPDGDIYDNHKMLYKKYKLNTSSIL